MMNRQLGISGSANMAMHALAILAYHDDQWRCNRKLASLLGVSVHSLAVVMQQLRRQGFIRSVRGARGGYLLDRDSSRITLLEICQAVDGKTPSEDCLLDKKACPGHKCIMGGLLKNPNRQVRDYLARTKLSEVAFRPPD